MQTVDNFLDSLSSNRTKELYAYHLDRFRKWCVGHLNSPDSQNAVITYLMELRNTGLSYSYRNLALSSIRHWYEMNDIVFNWKKISRFLGEVTFDNNIRGYTHEEILKLLSLSTVKHRAVILTLASTGMRREALANIRTTDMEYLGEYQLYKIKIYRKTPSEQICFTTPEAAKAIREFIKIRNSGWQPATLRPDRSYLLFGYRNQTSLSAMFRKLSIKAGVGQAYHEIEGDRHGQHRDEVPAVHGLRKFCITQMARAKVDTEIAKLLTGHSIGVRSRYLNYTDDDLLQEYLKAVDLLTINEENRLKRKVASLEQKDNELEKVFRRLQKVEEFLQGRPL